MTGAQVRLIAVALAIATLARAAPDPHEREPVAITLRNGLVLVLAPDPSVSSVVVHLRYADGAATETADEAGYTHLVERLAFGGSVHVRPGDYEARIDAAGGFTGSQTTAEDLTLWEQVPAGAEDLALWLQAERMAGLADGITDAGVASARDAIAGEYRSAYVDQPYGLVGREVERALWGARDRDVLGDGRALAQVTRERASAFIRARWTPDRATLVIAGAFDVDRTRAAARRYFEWIPRGQPRAPEPAVVVPRTTATRLTVTDPVAKVVVAYRLPDPDQPELLALEVAARALAGAPGTRLHRALVEPNLATAVDAIVVRQRGSSELRITITPAPNVPLGKLADTALAEIAAFTRQPLVERELDRAVATLELARLTALEGLVYRASVLAERPLDEARQLARQLTAISPLLLQRIVATWLDERAGVVVIGSPGER